MSKTGTFAVKTKPAPTTVLDTKDRPASIRPARGAATTSRRLPEFTERSVEVERLDDQSYQRVPGFAATFSLFAGPGPMRM